MGLKTKGTGQKVSSLRLPSALALNAKKAMACGHGLFHSLKINYLPMTYR